MNTNRYGVSVWQKDVQRTRAYPSLAQDLSADVVIVGAGITGLTAAAILSSEGKSVIVIEMGHVARGESGNTSAHLTEVFDDRYHTIARNFGQEGAMLAADSMRAALSFIEKRVQADAIDCAFKRVPGYLFSDDTDDIAELQTELTALLSVGVHAAFADGFPLPFQVKTALRIENQAQFQPLAYLSALARSVTNNGGRIFEQTRAIDFDDGEPCKVVTEHGTLTAKHVIVAAHAPVSNRVALLTKIAAYRSYVTAWELKSPVASGLYWDTKDPYHYIRTYESGDKNYLIVGGEDHKTGKERDTLSRYTELEAYTRARFSVGELVSAWSGQILESVDGLPFIGLNSASDHTYVATGYGGQGLTGGTIAGMMLSNAILERAQPWKDLYDARRIKPVAQARRYVSENVDYPSHAVADRFAPGEVTDVSEIPRGEGRLVRAHGHMLAIYRDPDDKLHARSAVCTHLGCNVKWNTAESSWDCPCHGGRFDCKGQVLNGPPLTDLKEIDADKMPEAKAVKAESPVDASEKA
jgi:glycine/D-amino acid oxidase-like deaminating enzyme/nitrite reductase/ring-hydroxylating ferredoxin subunit